MSVPSVVVAATNLMPGLRGSELIEKAREIRPDLKAVLITGYARVASDHPVDARISKPFRASDVAREVAKVLSSDVIDLESRRRGK